MGMRNDFWNEEKKENEKKIDLNCVMSILIVSTLCHPLLTAIIIRLQYSKLA